MIVSPTSSTAEGLCAFALTVAAAASTTVRKWRAASIFAGGMGTTRTVASVTVASVPSDPTTSFARFSGPSSPTSSRL